MNLLDGEVVLPVPGHEAFYLVSNFGRVFSKNYRMTGRTEELAQSSLRDKRRASATFYRRAKMWHINKATPTAIHRIVALAFVPNPQGLPMVNHIDGDKGNNRAANLEWCSNAENLRHAERTGLARHPIGEQHAMALMSDEKAAEVMRDVVAAKGRRGAPAEVAAAHGVSLHTVRDMARGKTWGHVRD